MKLVLNVKLLVHFAVGIVGGVLLAAASSFSVRRDFLLIFLSGFWAIMPDGHWILAVFGWQRLAELGDAFHDSVFTNVFWFHHFIDQHEPAQRMVTLYFEAVSLGVLLAAVTGYYTFRNWPTLED